MRFDQYMERCLYDPTAGFYATGRGRAGRRDADFVTSPEVGPLFGAVLALQLDRWWDEAGRPDPFVVVDAGTGPGTLLRSLEIAAPACAAAWVLAGLDPVRGNASLDLLDDLEGGVVIANELLDNLPGRVVERTADGWLELHVHDGKGELRPLDGSPPPFDLPVGARAPWLERAAAWVGDVLARNPAHLVAFDYGLPTTQGLIERGGWLRTYRGHERGDDPFADPGERDITFDVAFDQLPPPRRLATQAELLAEWGIEALVEEGRQYWADHAARPDLTALRMRSRVREAEALTDHDALGSWLVGLW